MTLYLIRHAMPGTKDYDNRHPGPGLGDLGQQQAKWIAGRLANEEIETVWSSDFTRTLETAAMLCESGLNRQLCPDSRLRERQAEEETHESLVQRISEWYQAAIEPNQASRVAVVAHGGSLNMILNLLDPGFQNFHYPFKDSYEVRTPIAGIWTINFDNNYASLAQCPLQ